MENVKAVQSQVMSKMQVATDKAKALASDFKTQAVTAAKDPKVQTTVGSAAGGTIILGFCGGALGVIAGGAAGAAVGLPFVLFTFGLSVPFSAAVGAGVAGSTGVMAGGTAGCATGGTVGYTIFTWRKELREFVNKVVDKFKQAKNASLAGVMSAFAATKARLVAARLSTLAQIQSAISITKTKVSVLTASSKQVAQDPKAQATAAGATVGGVALGGAGGVAGLATGVVAGGFVGIVPALFTFGLSIPVCAFVGGGAGLFVGTAVGSTTGAVGGGAVGYGAYSKRAEIAEGARKCRTYTTTRVGEMKAFVESKTRAAKVAPVKTTAVPAYSKAFVESKTLAIQPNVESKTIPANAAPVKSPVPESAKKTRPVGA